MGRSHRRHDLRDAFRLCALLRHAVAPFWHQPARGRAPLSSLLDRHGAHGKHLRHLRRPHRVIRQACRGGQGLRAHPPRPWRSLGSLRLFAHGGTSHAHLPHPQCHFLQIT